MDDILVIGAGPAGLLAAWVASSRGARVRVLAAGIGTTHLSPGWIGVLAADDRASGSEGQDLGGALATWIASHPQHPYALAGLDALHESLACLQEVCSASELCYVGGLATNYRLPTALGAIMPAALAPESFIAGDARLPGEMLIAGPAGWRDFYPGLCAGNLARQGVAARSAYFDLPEAASGKFDFTPVGLARLFEQTEVRARVASQVKPKLAGAARVGFPAVLGLERHTEVWRDLQDRLGTPVFEIPTLPPSVPGIRLYGALKRALSGAGTRILLDMTATRGLTAGNRALGVVVPSPAREAVFRAGRIILATGGLYGGGIASNRHGEMREAVFDLPVTIPDAVTDPAAGITPAWFEDRFLAAQGHRIHLTGIRASADLQPENGAGEILLENVRIAGRLLAGYNPVVEGSTEGVWLATAYRAAAA
jgi:glycerol-3-phosphate dehydrogenase subunit B